MHMGAVILVPNAPICLDAAPPLPLILNPLAAPSSRQLTYSSPANLADILLRVHSTYNWSVPGFSIDLEGELAIAMDTLTPAEVGWARVAEDRADVLCQGWL